MLAAAPLGAAERVTVSVKEAERRVDVAIDGAPFTAYLWPESLAKPVLWPIRTAQGTEITRGYPLAPKAGERADHPHHVGLWLNYGDVNGADFWGNPGSLAASRNPERLGRIAHRKIVEARGGDTGKLSVTADWLMPDGAVVLEESTSFVFRPVDGGRLIERATTLRATRAVLFKDTKEGMFGLRVARALEHPADAKEKGVVLGADLRPSPQAPLDNTGITGMYTSSDGKTGDAVWGTRARWVALSGRAGGEDVVIAILDHPANPGAPTHWHARGYGLFAANPLGQRDFSNGSLELNFSLETGDSATFRYGVAILPGRLDAARAEKLFKEFAKRRSGP
jgi:hypothetical protein